MRIPWCLLLFCVVQGGGCKETKVAAIAWNSVQLQPVTFPKPGVKITWEVKLDSGQEYQILTFNKGKRDLETASHFTTRVRLRHNISLLIDPVKKSDSGVYKLLIEAEGGREDITKFNVSVFDQVPKPNLTVLSAHLEFGWCNITLSCSVPGTDMVTYSWSRGLSLIVPDRDHQLHEHQSQLQLVINADNETSYSCNASNPASWDVNTVDVRTQCGSQTKGLTAIFEVVPWWVIVTGLVVLLLLMLSLIFLWKHRKKQRSCKDIDQALTIYEEVDESRTRRNANGNAQSRIIGNTIYSVVNTNPQPEVRAPQAAEVTVYAAVQRPRSMRKQKINPALLSTIYVEVQEAPSRPRAPQKPRSSSPNLGHLYS